MTSKLNVTGQTTSYQIGDDGDLQIGDPVVWTLLTTGQYAGSTNIVVNGKTQIMANTCAIESTHNNMWIRERTTTVGPGNNGLLLWEDAVNGEDIFNYVAQANLANLAGWNDWRVPNLQEVISIIEFEGVSPFVDETVFYNIASFAQSWSSTTDPLNALNAMVQQYTSVTYNTKAKNTGGPLLLIRHT